MFTALTLLSVLMSGAPSLTPGDHTRSLSIDGLTRTYLVHVPSSYDGTKPTPLVVAYHGGATDAAVMARFCGLNDKADRAGFIVVYPNGTGERPRLLTWNAGACCGYARRHQVDDVAFTRALLDDMARAARIDPHRIYATGMSNGGMMAYRAAAELADRIAAIAPVAGTMATAAPQPRRAVPVLHFHGTLDEFVPFGGGRGERSMTQIAYTSVEESISAWVAVNGCRRTPVVARLPNDTGDRMAITRTTYSGGRNGAEVVLYTVTGGGHTWPGQATRMAMLGPSTMAISANDLIWEFFEKHPLP